MDKGHAVHRAIRRELDRLAGEIIRRDAETDACLNLHARRARLLRVFQSRAGWLRCLQALLRS